MVDLSTIPQVAHAAPRIVHHVANCKPLIKQGFTWASIYWPIISHSVVAILSAVLGWSYRGRSLKSPAPIPAPLPAPTPAPVPASEVTDAPVV